MRWGIKRVNSDGTTRGGFRWPVGEGGEVVQDGPADGSPCGVGLHVAKTAFGASLAGPLTEGVGLLVTFDQADVLGEDEDRVRVRRCTVLPGTIDLIAVWGGALAGADLIGACLRRTDLSGANLHWADLTSADLTGADLSGADLTDAALTFARLIEADLSGANLSGADLRWAVLSGTDLTGATADADTVWPEWVDPAARGVVTR